MISRYLSHEYADIPCLESINLQARITIRYFNRKGNRVFSSVPAKVCSFGGHETYRNELPNDIEREFEENKRDDRVC